MAHPEIRISDLYDLRHFDRLISSLAFVPDREVDAALPSVAGRPIEYPLGSGQAEELALAARFKPMIRQLLPESRVDAVRARFDRAGFATELVPKTFSAGGFSEDDAPERGSPRAHRVLFIGRDRGRLHEAVAAELAEDADVALGRLLGYPRCCVEAFMEASPDRHNVELYARAVERTRGACAPRLNQLDFAVFHYISWSPCAFDCGLSLAYADAVAGLVARRYPSFVAAIDRVLALHRLVVLDELQLSVRGTFDGESLAIDEVYPTARDRHPDAKLDAALASATARVLVAVRSSSRISISSEGVVLESGEVIASPCALIAPFGARA